MFWIFSTWITLSVFLGPSVLAQDSNHRQTCSANDTACQATDYSNGQYQEPAKIIETINTEYGEPQVVLNIFSEETRKVLEETQSYITTHASWKFTCTNRHHLCSHWAATGECEKNSVYMKSYCAPTCQVCQVPEDNPQEADRAALIQASLTDDETAILVATAFGESQYVPTVNADPVVQVIAKATSYMKDVFANETYANVRISCKNKHSMCSLWGSQNECDNNPSYMTVSCAPACRTCERISYEYRCPFDKDAPTALYSGDLDKMFERVLKEYTHLTPTVLSRPPNGPWVVQLDTFSTGDECDRLVEYGQKEGYESSQTVGQEHADGTVEAVVDNPVRTSTNAWCRGECERDPVVEQLFQRMEDLLGIPRKNSEFLQLLNYEEGQFYHKHHDYLDHHQNRPQGVRILTLFLYLNDVEEGGETRFNQLNLDVKPRRGRAILWPSVLNEDPNVKDFRTEHEALAVTKGIKFGANAWIHQRDYVTPHDNNCA